MNPLPSFEQGVDHPAKRRCPQVKLPGLGVHLVNHLLLVNIPPVHGVEYLHDRQHAIAGGADDALLAHVDQFLVVWVAACLSVHHGVHVVVCQVVLGLDR